MARVRNKTDQELQVRLPERTFLAKPDEAIEVPDDLFGRYAWPETVWDVVEGLKRTTHKKADAAADSEEK